VTGLLVSFAAAGGAPQPSHEVVRVLRDGSVRALAGTVWPGLGSVSEAGAYAFELDSAALAELELLAEAAAKEELDGPLESGSGRFALGVGDDVRLQWNPFATPPVPVAALADRLRALLADARAHPVAAVRLGVEAAAGDPLRLTYRFTALGREPLTLAVASLSARVVEVPSEPSEPPPLAWVREATPVETSGGGRTSLAPGEMLTLEGATSAPRGRLRVDGFARVVLDLAAVGEAELEATLGAGPSPPLGTKVPGLAPSGTS
jgi:hypothetical protein